MRDEEFLQALLANPTDDALRLVYADWLEEQATPDAAARAEFLRLTAELGSARRSGRRRGLRKQLRQLAAELDTAWLAVVSRLRVESCQAKRAEAEGRRAWVPRFDYLCDRRWEDLRPTEDRAVRDCDACRQQVHYCDTIVVARRHAQQGHCIAVDLGVIRREGDLEPPRMWLGRPSAEVLRQERERVEPDPVSARRERLKREQGGDA